jgi:hypothetical protein
MLFLAMVTKAECSYDDLTALDALDAFNEQREIDEYLESNNLPLPETNILREQLEWVCASVYHGLTGFLKGINLGMRPGGTTAAIVASPCETMKLG